MTSPACSLVEVETETVGRSLLSMAEKWGLPPVEFAPAKLIKDGSHYHLAEEQRIYIYRQLIKLIETAWEKSGSVPIAALCKESSNIRKVLGIEHTHCNCE